MSARALLPIGALVVAGLAFGIGAARLVDAQRDVRASELQKQLEHTVEHGLLRHRVLQLELAQVAQQLARSPLTLELGLVLDFADRLLTLESSVYRAVPGPADDLGLMRLRAARLASPASGEPADADRAIVAAFAREYARRLAPARPGVLPSDLEAEGQAFVSNCVAIGVNHCLYRAAHDPLHAFAEAQRKGPRTATLTLGSEVLIAVDMNGIGRGDADMPSWSNVPGVTATLPVLAEALTTRAVVRDVGPVPGRDGLFVLVAVPLLEGEALRGAAVVGVALCGHRLDADAQEVGDGQVDLTWSIAGTLGVACSTLPLDDQPELDGERFLSARAAVAGNVSLTPTLVASMRKDLAFLALDELSRRIGLLAAGVAALLAVATLAFRRRGTPARAPGTPPSDPGSSDRSPPPGAG